MKNAAAEHDAEHLAAGRIVAGKYRIERAIGSGGMGVVLAATHMQLEQQVAMKVLRAAALRSPGAVERFLNEARTVARMRSEHVARIFDVGTLDTGEPYAVMELLEGKDLGEVLDLRGALPVHEAVSLLLQACEALAEAHSLGIVHRDIKPSNMFVTTGVDRLPMLKVIDFGLAKSLLPSSGDVAVPAPITQEFAVMGTPAYMSPEQLRDTRDVDARTDIWSLGVVAFEMLAARMPFDARSIADLCVAVVRDPAPAIDRRDVPRELEAAIAKCLEKDVTKRFAKVAAFAAAISPFAEVREQESVDRILRVQPLTNPPPRSVPDWPMSTVSSGSLDDVSVDLVVPKRSAVPRAVIILVFAILAAIAIAAWLGTRNATPPAPASMPTPIASPSRDDSVSSAPAVTPSVIVAAPPPETPPIHVPTATLKLRHPAPSSAPPPRATATGKPIVRDPLESR